MKSPRSGFTIVELIVVMAICTLLLSLLLPAVQRARETSRRMECLARLSQLGKALHGYESTHKTLPSCSNGNPLSGAAAHLHILPWIEQAALYEKLAQHLLSGHMTSRCETADCYAKPGENSISVFQCPSDWGTRSNNFVCNVGAAVAVTRGHSSRDPDILGACPRFHGPNRLADITDGLSNTAAMSERLGGGGNYAGFDGRRDTWFSGFELVSSDLPVEQMSDVCRDAHPNTGFTVFDLGSWKHSGFEFTWYNHAISPNSAIPNCSAHMAFPSATALRGLFPPRSLHSGGVNLLLLDGSVRFVSDSLDIGVWRNIGLAADGNVVLLP